MWTHPTKLPVLKRMTNLASYQTPSQSQSFVTALQNIFRFSIHNSIACVFKLEESCKLAEISFDHRASRLHDSGLALKNVKAPSTR